jgi:ACS family hexuronate transporter-like MFS transporter
MTAPPTTVADERASSYRWLICGLLFAVTAINYVDRQLIGVLKPTLMEEFGWSEIDYGDIVFWFQVAYAVGYIAFGKVVDRIGVKAGYALAFGIWTVAHVAHGFATNLIHFFAVRFVLGVGESGNFPAGIKAVAEWFPKRERALAIGLFNAGANVGAIITPLIVPFIVIDLAMGWQAAFIVTGIAQLVWLVAWLALYRRPRDHPRVSKSEIALIESDPPDPAVKVPWTRLLRHRETWAYAAGKFLIDPIWWFFLFWLPGYFFDRHGLDLKSFALPLVVIYVISDIGSIAGGWMSSKLIKLGASVNRARKLTMLFWGLLVLPVAFAQYVSEVWIAVAIVGIATAAHQAFSANLYTLPSDVFPRYAVGSVVGIGGTAGAIGGMLMAKYAGWVLDSIGSYTPIFIVAALTYLLALLIIQVLMPDYEPVKVE